MDAIVFHIASVISIVAALLVVTRKNPVYSAIFLVLFFITVSLDFLILRAPFLAVIQVLVYAGAIMVLFLFVIMLLNLSPEELTENVSPARKLAAGVCSAGLFLFLVAAIRHSPTVHNSPDLTASLPSPELEAAGETEAIGESLFNDHVLAFELVSILILVAIIGARHCRRRRGNRAPGGGRAPPRAGDQGARMTLGLSNCLYLSAAFLAIGTYGVLSRQNILVILMSLELMLNGVNLSLVAFGRAFLAQRPADASGPQAFVVVVLAVAAAEAGIGLSILLAVFRKWRTTNTGEIDLLKG
jgi:NADH-quinone oxidoreductase subunit J